MTSPVVERLVADDGPNSDMLESLVLFTLWATCGPVIEPLLLLDGCCRRVAVDKS